MKYLASFCALVLISGTAGWAQMGQQNSKQAALRKDAKISMEQAKKTALAKEPGKIQSKELEQENGKLIYSFDIRTKQGIREVNVDAKNGNIVEDSSESPAAEAQEKRQEQQHRQ